jgi:hypothetical protein
MTARKRILAGLLLPALVAGMAWEIRRARISDPMYEGKPLSYWVGDFGPPLQEIELAIRHAGTNAVPLLLRLMQARDVKLKRKLMEFLEGQELIRAHYVTAETRHNQAVIGFRTLRAGARSAIPELMRIYEENLSVESRAAVLESLRAIGPDARAAIPLLLRAATNHFDWIRGCAVQALGTMDDQAEVIVPVLINSLDDPDGGVQLFAVEGLDHFAPVAKAAFPKLLEFRDRLPTAQTRTDREWIFVMREQVEDALKNIDPIAAAKAGIQTDEASPAQ